MPEPSPGKGTSCSPPEKFLEKLSGGIPRKKDLFPGAGRPFIPPADFRPAGPALAVGGSLEAVAGETRAPLTGRSAAWSRDQGMGGFLQKELSGLTLVKEEGRRCPDQAGKGFFVIFFPRTVDALGRGYIILSDAAGWSSLEARRAHNPKVGGSNPPPATRKLRGRGSPPRPLSFGLKLLPPVFRPGPPRPGLPGLFRPPGAGLCRRLPACPPSGRPKDADATRVPGVSALHRLGWPPCPLRFPPAISPPPRAAPGRRRSGRLRRN